ncbi:hypothetical protein ILUMI_12657 [Ignelater luminosus]|uniref:Uncharacterized protein n=1 Tax=Ignelater luminosus TaxID=2038154 RepID=A0A8K0CY21_IGNLU|nr:hypothetical protein ILUMI_12657 [Ignelater luminosus]
MGLEKRRQAKMADGKRNMFFEDSATKEDFDSEHWIKDKVYHYEPNETFDSDADILSQPEENEGKEEDDEVNANTEDLRKEERESTKIKIGT